MLVIHCGKGGGQLWLLRLLQRLELIKKIKFSLA
jgi:hypothetical protein